jgi:hydroxyacyl-ACP dehydratase HTD2-like protein with hotdog domain
VEQTSNLSSFLMGVAWWGGHRIHYDYQWARHDGFDDVVVMGSHMYAWVDRLLTGWAGDPACLRKLSFRQLSVAVVGDALEVSAVVERKEEEDQGDVGSIHCAIEITKSDGTKVLTGSGIVRLPL